MDCPFCNINPKNLILENDSCYAIYDAYPVSKGHTLVIPKLHVSNYFEIEEELRNSLWDLVSKSKGVLNEIYNPDGYNIGVNVNKEAGQTIFHCHIHLIPRYKGDIKDPRGGVRGVIPGKQKYL